VVDKVPAAQIEGDPAFEEDFLKTLKVTVIPALVTRAGSF